MMRAIARGMLLALLAVLAGVVLQCSSDPAAVRDGGMVDGLLADLGLRDGPGAAGDADGSGGTAAGPLTRQVLSGASDAQGKGTVCGAAFDPDHPPAATLWTRGTRLGYVYWSSRGEVSYRPSSGCFAVSTDGSGSRAFRLVLVHGPEAQIPPDAGTRAATRRAGGGPTGPSGEATMCNLPFNPDDAPAVTVWYEKDGKWQTAGSAVHWHPDENYPTKAGCLRVFTGVPNAWYNLVVVK